MDPGPAETEPTADRIRCPEEILRRDLVDDGDTPRRANIGPVDRPPDEEPQSHRLRKRGTDAVVVSHHAVGLRLHPLDGDWAVADPAGKQRETRGRHIRHTRNRGQTLEDGLIERHEAFAAVTVLSPIETDDEELLRVHTELLVAQVH